MDYPSLLVDNDLVKQRRQIAQKPKDQEEFWAFYVLRPFSIYFSFILQRLHPNLLTITGIFLMILASGFFLSGQLLFGCLVFQAAYLFDCLDGEVARLNQKFSRYGKSLDFLLHAIDVPLLWSFTLGIRKSLLIPYYQMVIIFLLALVNFVGPRLYHYLKRTNGFDLASQLRRKNFIYNFLAFLFSSLGIYTIALPFIIFLPGFLPTLILICLSGSLAKTFARLIIGHKNFLRRPGD